MGYCKWIGGFLGALNGGVIGAVAGYAIGAFVDSLISPETAEGGEGADKVFGGNDTGNQDGRSAYDNGNYNSRRKEEGERNGFLFSMLMLSAHIIAADGKIMHSEMEHVRSFLRKSFGDVHADEGNEIILKIFDYKKMHTELEWHQKIAEACLQIRSSMNEEYRLQLVAFLAEITKADGRIDNSEVEALRYIAELIGLGAGVADQMLYTGGTSLEDAYKVLGLTPDATDEEVRKAYRNMALKYHPDRVASLGDDVKEAAQRKFQEINAAKEQIYQARNM